MENQLLDWALKYANNGYPVFPLHSVRNGRCTCGKSDCNSIGKHPRTSDGFKSATTDEATIRRWWQTWPDANIGLPTGHKSGVVVVDADGAEGTRIVQEKLKPNTATARTGKGYHYFFQAPAVKLKNQTRFWEKVDLRADGGYIVAPPSLHVSGKHYEWITNLIGGTPEELPDWFVQEMDAPSPKKSRPTVFINEPTYPPHFWEDLPDSIEDGERNSTLFSIAGKLRNYGWSAIDILPVLHEINNVKCVIPLDSHEVKSIAAKIERYPAGNLGLSEAKALGLEEFSDLGNAKRLVAKYGSEIRYCNEMKKWFTWNGHKWEEDKVMSVRAYATEVVRMIPEEHAMIPDKTLRDKLFKHALKSESRSSIESMVELAKSEKSICITRESLDGSPYLFHVKNGYIDLMTEEFHPPDSNLLNNKVANVSFDSEARCPLWERFLNEIMNNNLELMKYLQKAIGYSLTGSVDERSIFILHGTGANGKSTFINTIRNIFGDYAMQTPTSTLLVKNPNFISNDLARLCSARLVVGTELNEGQRFDESLIKQMTGKDNITSRFLYQESFEYFPRYKVFLLTNHLPTIHGTDNAIWGRR
jgi:putative DNA primase/helicase